MFKNPIGIAILALIVIGGGVWLYLYSIDPLHTSCAKVNADRVGLGERAADAVYDSLSDRAKARTTRAATRLHIDGLCQISQEDQAVSDIRDKLERELGAEPTP